jgi:outer membrane cobalamin receptor
MLRFRVLILFLLIFQAAHSQSHTISGYVEDINTGERIIGAYVIDSISNSVTQTNNFGFFILRKISVNSYIQARYIGLRSKIIHLSLVLDTSIVIQMQPVLELSEVVVSSSQYKHNVNTPLGLITIPVKLLTSIPALGESDLLKSIQSQPGIKGGVEGSAGIFVRGGGAGENLFMLDDVPMYNVSHLYGFFSAFNSSAIKDIKLLKGCFPARYGGRVSSVIDVRSLDGNNKSLKGEISLGVISSKLTLEGPLINANTTFIISGRRSYFDLYSGALRNTGILDKNFPDYYFYDLNARISHTFSQKDKIFLSFYKGKDKIKSKDENTSNEESEEFSENRNETSGWGNLIASIRWNHTFGNSLFANTTIAFSKYDFFTSDQYKSNLPDSVIKMYSADYKSEIVDFIVKTDFDYSVSNTNKLLFGTGVTFHSFHPGENHYNMMDNELNVKTDTSFSNILIRAGEPFFYIEEEFTIGEKLNIDAGLRVSGLISENRIHANPEPRLTANYSISPDLVIKTGYSRMVQYMHLLNSSGLSLPTDIWVPALKGLQPLKSDQINAGLAYELNKKFLISLEVYKKWLRNTTDYLNGSSLFLDLSPWYEKTTQGRGDSKGLEISVEKQEGRLTGSINYTLSRATRKYNDLNFGKEFLFKYDRLHDLNISVNFKISDKWDISAIWIYGTGYSVTVPVEKYAPSLWMYTQAENPWLIYYYPSINNCRLPSYHRLDLGVHYKKKIRLGEQALSFDIFNAYDRKNAVSVYYWDDYSFKYNYLLPIIPSITYTLKFK